MPQGRPLLTTCRSLQNDTHTSCVSPSACSTGAPPIGSTRAATLPHSLFHTHAYTHIYTYIYSPLFFLIPIYHKPYATADRLPPHDKERD